MHNIGFAPDAEDTSLLAQYPVGTPLKTEVRIVFKLIETTRTGTASTMSKTTITAD